MVSWKDAADRKDVYKRQVQSLAFILIRTGDGIDRTTFSFSREQQVCPDGIIGFLHGKGAVLPQYQHGLTLPVWRLDLRNISQHRNPECQLQFVPPADRGIHQSCQQKQYKGCPKASGKAHQCIFDQTGGDVYKRQVFTS